MESYNNTQTCQSEPSQDLHGADMTSPFALAALNSDVLPENDIMSIVMKRRLGGVSSGVREKSPFAPPEKKFKTERKNQCGFEENSYTIKKGIDSCSVNMVHQSSDEMSSSDLTMTKNEELCNISNFQSLDSMACTEIKIETKNSELNYIGNTGTSKSSDDLASERRDENTSEKLVERQEEGLDKTKDLERLVETEYLNLNGSKNNKEMTFNDLDLTFLKAKAAMSDQFNVDSIEGLSQSTGISVSKSKSPKLQNYDQRSVKFKERSENFTDNIKIQEHSKNVSKCTKEESPELVKECNVSFESDESNKKVEPYSDLNVSEVTTEKGMFQISNVLSLANEDETKYALTLANDSFSYNADQEDVKENHLKKISQKEDIIGPMSFDFETRRSKMKENKSITGSRSDAVESVKVKQEPMSDSSHESNDEVKPTAEDEDDCLNDQADQTDPVCYYNDEEKGECPYLDNGDDDDAELSEHYDIKNVKHIPNDQGPVKDKVNTLVSDGQGPANFEGHGTVYIETLEVSNVKRGTGDEISGSNTSTCNENCFDKSNIAPLHLQTNFIKHPVVNDLTVEKLLEQNQNDLSENFEVVEKLQEIRFNKYRKISIDEKKHIVEFAKVNGVSNAAKIYGISRSAVSSWIHIDFTDIDEDIIKAKKDCLLENQTFEDLVKRVKSKTSKKFKSEKANKFKSLSKEDKFEVSRYARLVGLREISRRFDIGRGTLSRWMRQFPYMIKPTKKDVSGKCEQTKSDNVRESRGSTKNCSTTNRKVIGPDGNEEKADEIDELIAVTYETPNVDECFEDAKVLMEGTILENDTFFEKLFKRVVECRADKYKYLKASEKLEAVRYAKRIGVRKTAKILGLGTGTMSGWITKYQEHLSLTADFYMDQKQSDSPLLPSLDSSLDASPNDNNLLNESLNNSNLSSSTLLDKPEEVLAVRLILKNRFDYFKDKIEHAKKFKFKNITQDERIEVVQCTKVAGIRPTARVLNLPIGTLSGWIRKYM